MQAAGSSSSPPPDEQRKVLESSVRISRGESTDAGLRIEFLHEFPFVEWPMPFLDEGEDGKWRLPKGSTAEVPLFFSLKATKPASF